LPESRANQAFYKKWRTSGAYDFTGRPVKADRARAMSIDYKKMMAKLLAMVFLTAAFTDAWAIESTLTAPSKSKTAGDLAVFYARSTADSQNSYFKESYGTAIGLKWTPSEYASFRVSTSLTREIGVLEEKFRASNTDVILNFKSYKPWEDIAINSSTTVTLPSNEDDRQYLTYRGSVGGSASVVKSFPTSSIFKRTSITGNVNVTRSFFEFDANREGGLNRFWGTTAGISAAQDINDKLAVGVGGSYISYKPQPKYSIRLESVTTDRTFNYDYNTNNIALYDAEISSVVGTLKYDI
jgi:hypothetical protein